MSNLVMAIDQGTTSSRALIVSPEGTIQAVAQTPVDMIYPHPGWVNQNATNLWETTRQVAHEAAERAGARHSDIKAIGITNQRETTILWDRATLDPVAIVRNRATAGGPQPAEMDRMLAEARQRLAQQDGWIKDRRGAIAAALAKLDADFG